MLRSGHVHKLAWHTAASGAMELYGRDMYENNYQAIEAAYGIKQKTNENENTKKLEVTDNLFLSMRGFLILGRILGIIPVSGVFNSTHNTLKFHTISFPVIMNLVITSMLAFSTVLAIIETIRLPKLNALDIAQSIQGTIFKVWGLTIYIYFLIRAETFIKVFKSWGKSSLYFSIKDQNLRRDIIIISSIIFVSAFCESFLFHMEDFPQFDYFNKKERSGNETRGKSSLHTYYSRSHKSWEMHVGYHPILAVIALLTHNLMVAAWNYVDVLGIIFSRALYFKFKALCEVAGKMLNIDNQSSVGKPCPLQERLCWTHIVRDHDTLCSVVDGFEAFLSPLIFGSYATNIYYICMQLIDGLTPDKVTKSIAYSIFAPWSFLHLLIRMVLLSINAARINTYAHDIGTILKRCPIDYYESEVARVDKHVTGGPEIGLTGLGCFHITKPFLLSIINVVFTVEIVLLQGLSADTGPCPQPSK